MYILKLFTIVLTANDANSPLLFIILLYVVERERFFNLSEYSDEDDSSIQSEPHNNNHNYTNNNNNLSATSTMQYGGALDDDSVAGLTTHREGTADTSQQQQSTAQSSMLAIKDALSKSLERVKRKNVPIEKKEIQIDPDELRHLDYEAFYKAYLRDDAFVYYDQSRMIQEAVLLSEHKVDGSFHL